MYTDFFAKSERSLSEIRVINPNWQDFFLWYLYTARPFQVILSLKSSLYLFSNKIRVYNRIWKKLY